jgi:hypothetical protein
MTLSKFKETGEALSIIVVLVTLIFLILEVRENTAAIRTESYGDSIDRLNEWRLSLASDKELIKMFADFNSGETLELDRTEGQQLSFVLGSLWSIYESAYFAQSYGTLGESEWSRFEQMMCGQYEYALAQEGAWETELRNLLSAEFGDFVEERCG